MRSIPYEIILGFKYIRSGKSGQNSFISFISTASMIGIALGVAALIIVLSVMNGFQKEVRAKMMSVFSHVEVFATAGQEILHLENVIQIAKENKEVIGAAPFVKAQGLIANGDNLRGVLVQGIDPKYEGEVADFAINHQELFNQLEPNSFKVTLGVDLAKNLGITVGDLVTLILPKGQVTPAGIMPRLKQMRVIGLFESGHYEYDANLIILHYKDVMKLFQLEGPTGIRLRLNDFNKAEKVTDYLADNLTEHLYITNWTLQNKVWYDSIKIEKRMMFIILTLIVAVAAFNLVSTLIMTVTDKISDIAILKTLGAKSLSIMLIFIIQGSSIGIIGTLLGLILGLLVAFNLSEIVLFIERLFNAEFLPKELYYINYMPSDPQLNDILPIILITLGLSFIATIYPSFRASRVQPAKALRYE